MSFLLKRRNSSRSAHPSTTAKTASRDGTHPRLSTISQGQPSSTSKVVTGMQMQIQRTVTPQAERQLGQKRVVSHGRQSLRAQSTVKQSAQSSEVISMAEVLADLQVLEQQQRDAQRQLESARLVKEQRSKHQAEEQSQLEHMKYSNGQMRAQVRQSRELLSLATRSLGNRRLDSERNGDKLRAFEAQLKKARLSVRANQSCCRKLDSLIIGIENKVEEMSGLKTAMKAKIKAAEDTVMSQQQTETGFRGKIQKLSSKDQVCIDSLAELRSGRKGAEEELRAAQNMEESTRVRSQALTAQAAKATAEHETLIDQTKRSIQAAQVSGKDIKARLEKVDKEYTLKTRRMEEITELLTCHRNALVSKTAEQLHATGFDPTAISRVVNEKHKESEGLSLDELKLSTGINGHREKLDSHTNRSKDIVNTIAHTVSEADGIRALEEKRSQAIINIQLELDTEKTELDRLSKSCNELLDARNSEGSNHNGKLSTFSKSIEDLQSTAKEKSALVEKKREEFATTTEAWPLFRKQLSEKLELCKGKRSSSEEALSTVQATGSNKVSEARHSFLQEVEKIRESNQKEIDAKNTSVLLLIDKYPALQHIVDSFQFDKDQDRRAQGSTALQPLKRGLESMIRSAKIYNQSKRQKATEKKRRNELAAKIVKQKDKSRRREMAPMGTVNRRDDRTPIQGTVEAAIEANAHNNKTKRQPRPSGRMKDASFFVPENKGYLSDEGTPAQPKRLLETFSGVSDSAEKDVPGEDDCLDKHVRWKDQDAPKDETSTEVTSEKEELSHVVATLRKDANATIQQRFVPRKEASKKPTRLSAVSSSRSGSYGGRSKQLQSDARKAVHNADQGQALKGEDKSRNVEDGVQPTKFTDSYVFSQSERSQSTSSGMKQKRRYGTEKSRQGLSLSARIASTSKGKSESKLHQPVDSHSQRTKREALSSSSSIAPSRKRDKLQRKSSNASIIELKQSGSQVAVKKKTSSSKTRDAVQSSGLSSREEASKGRRRKRKEPATKKRKASSLDDGKYSFSF